MCGPTGVITRVLAAVDPVDGSVSVVENLSPIIEGNMAVDADGNLYIAQYNAHTLVRYTPAGVFEHVAGGRDGSAGNTGDFGPAVDALLRNPRAVTVTAEGDVVFTDSQNCMVRRIWR